MPPEAGRTVINRSHRAICAAWTIVAGAAAAVMFQGCSGFGGSGADPAQLRLITAESMALPLWQLGTGAPSPCPFGVFLNSRITFTFGGPVSPASLPQGGLAAGSINIADSVTQQLALGTFSVEDDPAFPTGNQRRVVFTPDPPSNPNAPCGAGLAANVVYTVNVPLGGVIVAGLPLQNSADACFSTCGCPDPGGCASPFTDPVSGPPYVVATTPPTSDPPPPGVAPASIAGNTIQIVVSEPLNPSGIDLSSVRIVDVGTGAQVPGSLVFHQAGAGMPARIDYVAAAELATDRTFEILLFPAIRDFGGHPIQTSQADPGAKLFFRTIGLLCPQPPLVETFDTTQNLASVSGALQWTGNGQLQTVFPFEYTGDGSDGAFSPPVGPNPFLLDTNQIVNGQSRQGKWNFTSVNIPAGATVRIIGPYRAHIRCTGAVTIDGTLLANAGMANPAIPGYPPYDRGAAQGYCGSVCPCEALGGVGNAGGGDGGTGSGMTPPPGSPPMNCGVRALSGEAGFGPRINGGVNTGSPPNDLYAGGQGGDSGCFPASAVVPDCAAGDLGGLGGAGGTAGRAGEAGLPRSTTSACTPLANVVQPIAQPSPVAIAMVSPISVQSAGSGGGGGGDHLEPTNPPSNDDPGGGGGGAGGGLRISCVGAFSQGSAGTIRARGSVGGTAVTFGGAGGSGSGGEIWIQTFATATIAASATMDVTGPGRLNPTIGNIGCSGQASGGGGAGLIQIEAGQGPPATPSFTILPTPTPTSGAVFSNPPFVYGSTVTGHAQSNPWYTGTTAPDYTGAVESIFPGNASGAVLAIRYEGAAPAVGSTPQNPMLDPATIKSTASGGGPITAANLDELDGYAFIWFVVDVSFLAPPATPANAVLPSVDSITINYNAALNCP